mmetsp:Transcript_110559/g.311819  ORF Transcript_110559/g.311819 Transcript_110559/m.311819 type:complete len:215 (-) Transcript_110559:1230-1874(-)
MPRIRTPWMKQEAVWNRFVQHVLDIRHVIELLLSVRPTLAVWDGKKLAPAADTVDRGEHYGASGAAEDEAAIHQACQAGSKCAQSHRKFSERGQIPVASALCDCSDRVQFLQAFQRIGDLTGSRLVHQQPHALLDVHAQEKDKRLGQEEHHGLQVACRAPLVVLRHGIPHSTWIHAVHLPWLRAPDSACALLPRGLRRHPRDELLHLEFRVERR